MLPAGPVTLAVRSGAPLMAAAIYYGQAATVPHPRLPPPVRAPGRTSRFRPAGRRPARRPWPSSSST